MENRKQKVIFVLGSGYCGSTLVDMILGAHSQIFGAGEISYANTLDRCVCKKLVNECSYWESLGTIDVKDIAVFRSKKDFLLNNKNYHYLFKKGVADEERYISTNKKIFDSLQKKSGKDIFVDSSKNVDRVEFLSKADCFDKVILHIVRDGRAVGWSYMKKYNSFFPYIWRWFATNMKIELLRIRTRLPYVFIHYDYFTRNPSADLKRINSVLGVKFEESSLHFREKEQHQVGGNRMRLRKNEGRILRDEEWKKKLPLRHKIIFLILFGWINAIYKKRAKDHY